MNKDTAEARGKQSLAVECLRTLYSVGDLPGLRDRVHNNRVSISRTGCDVDSALPTRAESDATGGLCSTCHNPIHKAVIETGVLVSYRQRRCRAGLLYGWVTPNLAGRRGSAWKDDHRAQALPSTVP